MKHTRLLACAIALGALAGSAAALESDPAVFTGTLSGKGSGKVKGLPKQTTELAVANTILEVRTAALRFSYTIDSDSLGGPMKAGRRGSFKVAKATGEDLDDLKAQVAVFIANQLGVNVTLDKVKVTGSHKPAADERSINSKLSFRVKGTTTLGSVPFKGKAKLKYASLGTLG